MAGHHIPRYMAVGRYSVLLSKNRISPECSEHSDIQGFAFVRNVRYVLKSELERSNKIFICCLVFRVAVKYGYFEGYWILMGVVSCTPRTHCI